MKTNEISNSQDVIDSRDVMERLEELQAERDELLNESEDEEKTKDEIEEAKKALTEWDEENGEELEALQKLEEEASGAADWQYGETLIRESYFTEYCEELCKDIGDIPKDLPWYIADNIDWDGVADAIKADYTEVDFDGVTYYMRA